MCQISRLFISVTQLGTVLYMLCQISGTGIRLGQITSNQHENFRCEIYIFLVNDKYLLNNSKSRRQQNIIFALVTGMLLHYSLS